MDMQHAQTEITAEAHQQIHLNAGDTIMAELDSLLNSTRIQDVKPTLLIVDDEEGPRKSVKTVFRNEFRILLACNAAEAMNLAHENHIDVAILDILMYGMSGLDLLVELKRIAPHIQVVMFTAYETSETVREALRHGACDYLDKPFAIPTMRSAVARALEKSKAAQEIQQSSTQLQSLQKELQAQRLMEEMARTKGEIYASVLHDINSPLTAIAGFVELINRVVQNTDSLDSPRLTSVKSDLKQLRNQVSHCFEISRRYLSFLNASEENTPAVCVQQILIDLKCLLLRHPKAQGHDLIIDEIQPDIFADINGTDLLQILLNITINALQCTDLPHRVEVRSRRLTAPLAIAQFGDGPHERFINRDGFLNRAPILAITVTDNGPGIGPEVLGKLFDQHITTKRPGCGTGLGLSIVKRLITENKGAIHIETSVTRGSTFTILLQAPQDAQIDLIAPAAI